MTLYLGATKSESAKTCGIGGGGAASRGDMLVPSGSVLIIYPTKTLNLKYF